MKKRSLFLSGLLATSLLVGGVLVGCNQADDANDSTDNTDTTDTTNSTDTLDTTTATTYNIALAETNEVEATLSANEATAGTKIDITIVSVPDGYNITSITSDVSGLEIQAESETLYTFNMPESDVNLTINIEVIEYEANAIYITNTGDVPSKLQASSFYVTLYFSYTGVTGIYYCFSDSSSRESRMGDCPNFGISDTNIDVSTYNLRLTWHVYLGNDETYIDSPSTYIGTTSNIVNSGKGIEWIIVGYLGTTFITINWTSNT